MKVTYDNLGKVLIMEITEEIDHHTASKIRSRADFEIEKSMPKKAIFDFNKVTFMDSSGIGMVIGRYKLVSMLRWRNVYNKCKTKYKKNIRNVRSFKNNTNIGGRKMENKMKLEFGSKSTNEAFARVSVAAFVVQLDPTIEELADIKTAVSEAVTNSIIHGYEEKEGIIKISCKLTQNLLEIEISDAGKGIEDINKARELLYTSKPEQERSGMGFTIMESFMDEVEIESTIGVGTKIVMKKTLKSEEVTEEEIAE